MLFYVVPRYLTLFQFHVVSVFLYDGIVWLPVHGHNTNRPCPAQVRDVFLDALRSSYCGIKWCLPECSWTCSDSSDVLCHLFPSMNTPSQTNHNQSMIIECRNMLKPRIQRGHTSSPFSVTLGWTQNANALSYGNYDSKIMAVTKETVPSSASNGEVVPCRWLHWQDMARCCKMVT